MSTMALLARAVMHAVVRALQYLHAHGIMHRDVSASNLLLLAAPGLDGCNSSIGGGSSGGDCSGGGRGGEGNGCFRVKLGDFGLAVQLQPEGGPGAANVTLCGTANFIAPEVAARRRHGLAADRFSLGCLLYYLLVGAGPFQGDANATPDVGGAVNATLARVVRGEYHVPASVSPAARDLVVALLQPEPADRLGLADVLRHAFMQGPAGLPDPTAAILPAVRAGTRWGAGTDGPLYPASNGLAGAPQRLGGPPLLPSQVLSLGGSSNGTAATAQPGRIPPPTVAGTAPPATLRPIATARLRPVQHNSGSAAVGILPGGTVRLRFHRPTRGGLLQMDVAPDGLAVTLTASNGRVTAASFGTLPARYHNYYRYIACFVDLVRAKTPRVVLHTSDGTKCVMMENDSRDLDVRFSSGARVCSHDGQVVVTVAGGARATLGPTALEGDDPMPGSEPMQSLGAAGREGAGLLQEARRCWHVCRQVERAHERE